MDVTKPDCSLLSEEAQIAIILLRSRPDAIKDRLANSEPSHVRSRIPLQQQDKSRRDNKNENIHERNIMQSEAHDCALHALHHSIAATGNGTVKMEVHVREAQSTDANGNPTSANQRTDLSYKVSNHITHADVTLYQAQAPGRLADPEDKTNKYYTANTESRTACATSALYPFTKAIHGLANSKTDIKQAKYSNVPTDTNNKKIATVRTFFPVVASTNGILHQSSLDYIQKVVEIDPDNMFPGREAYLRAYFRNAIITYAATSLFAPIPPRTVYVHHLVRDNPIT